MIDSLRRRLAFGLAVVVSVLALSGGAGAAAFHVAAASATPDFGPNVKIFDPSMSTSQIKATVDAIAAEQVSNQFGTQRYAVLRARRLHRARELLALHVEPDHQRRG